MSAAAGLAALAALLAVAGASALVPGRRAGVRAARDGRAAAAVRLLAAGGRGARRRLGARAPAALPARIAAAGGPAGLGPREVMAAKLAGAAAAAVACLPIAALAPGRLGTAIAVASPVAGFLAPDWWLARRAAERERG